MAMMVRGNGKKNTTWRDDLIEVKLDDVVEDEDGSEAAIGISNLSHAYSPHFFTFFPLWLQNTTCFINSFGVKL